MTAAKTPRLSTDALRAAGRDPQVPFSLALENGSEVTMLRLLRVLPGRRLVGEARHGERQVLAKLFISLDSERHFVRERDGIAALTAAGISTPEIVAACRIADGGHALLTRFIDDARDLAQIWEDAPRTPGDPAAIAVIAPALAALGHMHAAGLTHGDLHLGNFLHADDVLFVLDGDAVSAQTGGGPLPPHAALQNLAILLAQFPAEWDEYMVVLLTPYVGGGGPRPDVVLLRDAVRRFRARRLADLLAKSVRDCTLFSVEQSRSRFVSVVRSQAERVSNIVAEPDAAIAHGEHLKDGRTASVARVRYGNEDLVVKRYNLKSLGHALSRLWRPSRAWHSWLAAHRLVFCGIATPRPLALIEERFGPLRRRAWLVTEHCPGPDLAALLDPNHEPPVDVARAIIALFRDLARERISHGDLKATNLLWHQERIFLIDLDAMQAHRTPASHARAWQRDRARLLRNWPEDSVLTRWLAQHLP